MRVSHPDGLWVRGCVPDVGLLSELLSGLTSSTLSPESLLPRPQYNI